MQLYFSHTSPYARKVTMLLYYTGFIEQCELVSTRFDSDALRQRNPLGKIPALVDGDFLLFDSVLICEYLDDKYALSGSASLLNRGEGSYYAQQKLYYTANGILDAAVATVMELRRDTEHSQHWLERWQEAIDQSLNTLALAHAGSAAKPTMGTFALASALGYLDFRLSNDVLWREKHPKIHDWYASLETCDWFQLTAPPAN